MNGALTVYRDDVVAANEWKFLAQSMHSPAQIHAIFFPALLPEGGEDVRKSRRQIAGCVFDAVIGIVVAADQVGVAARV